MPQAVKPKPRRVRVSKGLYLRDGRVYELGYRAEGKQCWRPLPGMSLEDAIVERAKLDREKKQGTLRAPVIQTVRDVWLDVGRSCEARVVSGELSGRSLALYEQRWSVLEPEIGDKRVQSVTLHDIEVVLDALRMKGLSSWTRHGYRGVLSQIFKQAVRHKLIASSPMEGLKGTSPKRKKEIRVLTPVEVESLLAKAGAYRDFLACLVYSGLRLSEALGLTWENVDTDNHRLNVEYQLSPSSRELPAERVELKTDKSRRRVPMLGPLSLILAARYEAEKLSGFPAKTAYVFGTKSGKPLNRNAIAKGMGEAARLAGIKGASCHSLRHTFASAALGDGIDVSTVSRWLGHANATMTLDVYSHWIDDKVADSRAVELASARYAPKASEGEG